VDCLHFELCYYSGIEYAISHGLQCFEGGAQGEHKLARGFTPVITHSAHWIAHPQFRRAIADWLAREREAIGDYQQQLFT
jgi:predicted N-acyltransferase